MQDKYEFDKKLIEDLYEKLRAITESESPFEYDRKEVQAGITALKQAYIEKNYEDAKSLIVIIDDSIGKLERKAMLPEQKETKDVLKEQYSLIINSYKEQVKEEPKQEVKEEKIEEPQPTGLKVIIKKLSKALHKKIF